MNDAYIAKLCSAIYDDSYRDWDFHWDGVGLGDIVAGIKDNVLVFRGSITTEDWLRDLTAFPQVPTNHVILGQVHSGFYEGMDEFFVQAANHLSDNPIICGHSLGAARAWLFGGRFICQGGRTKRIVTFGSPRPGCEKLQSILKHYDKVSYKNRHDPVTDVPVWLPDFPVVDMCEFTMLDIPPAINDTSPLADHHMPLYDSGAEALYG